MISLSLECADGEVELISAELWDRGASGILEDPQPGGKCLLRAWFQSGDGLEEQFAPWHARLAEDPDADRDWEAETRQAWQPFALGTRLWLAPEWDESPTPAGRLRLIVHPGLALGTGAHPATQLCLEALERHVRTADHVLDIGTGSGILMSAAYLLGVRKATGCDMDADALGVARANLMKDGVPSRLFAGSTRAVRGAGVDLIVSNINATTHRTLAREYKRIARRLLIVSGYQTRHSERVRQALEKPGWRVEEELQKEDWVCHICFRDDRS